MNKLHLFAFLIIFLLILLLNLLFKRTIYENSSDSRDFTEWLSSVSGGIQSLVLNINPSIDA